MSSYTRVGICVISLSSQTSHKIHFGKSNRPGRAIVQMGEAVRTTTTTDVRDENAILPFCPEFILYNITLLGIVSFLG